MTCNKGTISVLKFQSFQDWWSLSWHDTQQKRLFCKNYHSDQCPAFNNGRFCSNGLYHSVNANICHDIRQNLFKLSKICHCFLKRYIAIFVTEPLDRVWYLIWVLHTSVSLLGGGISSWFSNENFTMYGMNLFCSSDCSNWILLSKKSSWIISET